MKITTLFVLQEAQESQKLNFENEESVLQKENADDDLRAAQALYLVAENDKYDEKAKKAFDKKSVQNSFEATEKYQKVVLYADEQHKYIQDDELHNKLEHTHNVEYLQREMEKAQLNILDEEDVEVFSDIITGEKGRPYNNIRYSKQNIRHENAAKALKIAEKAKNRCEEIIAEQKIERVESDMYEIIIPFD